MTIEKIKQTIKDCGNDVYFEYHDKKCGIEPTVENGMFTFEMWCGSILKEYRNFDEMVNDKIFDGKSVIDIMGTVDFSFC